MKKEHLKKYNIVCINDKEIKECFDLLEKLGFNIEKREQLKKNEIIIKYYLLCNIFITSVSCYKDYKNISFYNFKKEAKKILKEEEKEKLEDFEVAKDGRITKVNNWESDKKIYGTKSECPINTANQNNVKKAIKYGLVYATEEARDKALFKLEIENQLKNIAERLNNREKIDWKNSKQEKCCLVYDTSFKKLICDSYYTVKRQGQIYCLSENFLKEAKKEIEEDNLIKYFTEE